MARAQCVDWTPGYEQPAPLGMGLGGTPTDVIVFDDGTGETLYASAGMSGYAAGVSRFDGTTWFSLGGGFNHDIQDLEVYDDGVLGPRLFVGGYFTLIAGQSRNRITYWDGMGWASLAGGVAFINGVWIPSVADMTVYDDGSGPRLAVVGDFDLAGGVPANFVGLWDGNTWTALGSGTNHRILSVATFDDGSGMALYVAGHFTQAGGVPAAGIARWNGSSWSAVGSGSPFGLSKLAVHDDGTGLQLYGVASYGGVHRWNGTVWQKILNGSVAARSVASYDDGSGAGPKLYVTTVISIGGVSTIGTGIWDGIGWQVDTGQNNAFAMTVWDDGQGPALFAVGQFTQSGAYPALHIARFGPTNAPGCTAFTGMRYCFGDGLGTPCPCGNAGAPGHGCANSANAQGATLLAEGQAHVSSDTVTLRAAGTPPTATMLFFQGTGQSAGGLGLPFGDGLRCSNGTHVRLAVRSASGGVASFGHAVAGDLSLSAAGHLPASWCTRTYQVWYRDAQTFCYSTLYNLTNGVSIRWAP